jgi:hypothetical protein
MAKAGIRHVDVGAELTKTEWESEDSHELIHGTSFPSSPVERQLFYRDDEHKWYIYDGTDWVWLGGGSGGGMEVHGNEYHDPDFEQQGVAATLVESHRTTETHAQAQPPAEHGNESHNPDFATEAALSSHAAATTGVHGLKGAVDFSVYATSNQLVPKSVSTKIAFDTKDWDVGDYFDLANERYQPGVAGKYLVAAGVQLQGLTPGTDVVAILYKNGGFHKILARLASVSNALPSGSSIVSMNGSTDYLEFYVLHYDSADRYTWGEATRVWFQGFLISQT